MCLEFAQQVASGFHHGSLGTSAVESVEKGPCMVSYVCAPCSCRAGKTQLLGTLEPSQGGNHQRVTLPDICGHGALSDRWESTVTYHLRAAAGMEVTRLAASMRGCACAICGKSTRLTCEVPCASYVWSVSVASCLYSRPALTDRVATVLHTPCFLWAAASSSSVTPGLCAVSLCQ